MSRALERTGSRQATALEMLNSTPGVHGWHFSLIVEGESDRKFFNKFMDCSKCIISVVGKGNNNKGDVIEFIEKQNKNRKNCYLGVVDADFDRVIASKQKRPLPPNIIMTDCHDMEMTLLNSHPDMSSIYAELSVPGRIRKYEKDNQTSFIESVINAAYEIGILKLSCINRDKYHQLGTKDLEISDCIDKNLNIKMETLIKRVVVSNPGKGASESNLEEQISNEKAKGYSKYQIGCGHDVTKILEISFTSDSNGGLGYGNEKHLNTSRIESLLRAVYTAEDFKQTELYKSIVKWETDNDIQILDRERIPD